jgi:RNA polymerase sigma-70 factor (ECF subfamily)
MNSANGQQWLTDEGRPDFEVLFEKARPQLLALARRIMRNEADAEDVVQQAFIQGLRNGHRFEARAQATSWMYRITYNAALMALRTKRRKGASSLDGLPQEVAEVHVSNSRDEEAFKLDPDHNAERAEMRAAIAEAMAQLAPIDQKIVGLRINEGCSTQEVAKEMGLSAAATKTRLHRARKALREVLSMSVPEYTQAYA